MFVLGLQGSPRKGGNTDTFLSAFLDGAARKGAAVKAIQAAKAGIVACKGCGYCEKKGTCVITDDPMAMEIYGLIRRADLVVAASPVYFYGISAQLKILIDRCQTLWSRKYVLKVKDPLASERKGLLFSVAASRGRQLFDGIHLTAKYFFDAIDARMENAITYRASRPRVPSASGRIGRRTSKRPSKKQSFRWSDAPKSFSLLPGGPAAPPWPRPWPNSCFPTAFAPILRGWRKPPPWMKRWFDMFRKRGWIWGIAGRNPRKRLFSVLRRISWW